jgi:transcriptional regulator with XRE-family HTH domain
MLWLGRAIAERRRGAQKTQEDLAYEAGLSLRHLQKIEAGQTFPRLQTLFAIGAALEIKPQRLLDRAETLQDAGTYLRRDGRSP